jgi:hypothetical protein
MGAVCCRCHNTSGLDDAILRLPAPLSVSMSAGERLLSAGGRAGAGVGSSAPDRPVPRALSMSAASPAADERFRVPLSQSLANYVSFPFPFVTKPKPAKKKPGRLHGLWVSKRRASGGDAASSRPEDARALASMPYVGEYWRRSATGGLVPLSLLDLCIRRVCAQVVDAQDSDQLALPTELAARALVWLKQHSLLEKHAFQTLARSLLHEWNLSGQHDVCDEWFDDLPWAPLQQLACLDLSGCAQLAQLGSDRWQMVPQLPRLVKVSFHGCVRLEPRAVEMLQFSPKLTSIVLAGCSRVDDRCLEALSLLPRLKVLDLVRNTHNVLAVRDGSPPSVIRFIQSGCRLVTDAGIKSLRCLELLETLRLSRCSALTDDAFDEFGSRYPRLKELDIAHCRIR